MKSLFGNVFDDAIKAVYNKQLVDEAEAKKKNPPKKDKEEQIELGDWEMEMAGGGRKEKSLEDYGEIIFKNIRGMLKKAQEALEKHHFEKGEECDKEISAMITDMLEKSEKLALKLTGGKVEGEIEKSDAPKDVEKIDMEISSDTSAPQDTDTIEDVGEGENMGEAKKSK